MRGGVNNPMSAEEGGIPRPFGGYQSNMRPVSPDTVWPIHSFVPKSEPVEHEDRTDSGINSASDFHSSSPGSDRSENIPYTSSPNNQITPQQMHQTSYYSTPVNGINPPNMLHHIYNYQNPSSSPYLESQINNNNNNNNNTKPSSGTLDERSEMLVQQQFSLSPSTSSNVTGSSQPQTSPDNGHPENPLRKLQMALENNSLLSPKSNDYSCEDEAKSENDGEEFDDQELKVPKINSHGKVRTHKCKQCDFVAITKYEYYEHIKKEHIKASKLLTCSKCPFVTEYKHHFEYHLRNHMGCKPFKCPQCNYTCVNKSMLSSHKKSHSNIYQYRCATCQYATKYCHSLKTHLRKYNHEPAMVLNPDGTPNPLPIIDVYGKRRGPKLKTQEQKPAEEVKSEQFLPFPFNQMMFAPSQLNVPLAGFPFIPGLPGVIQHSLFQNLEKIAQEQGAFQPPQEPAEESSASSQPDSEVLDLSKPEKTTRSRRKGRAFKLTPTHENSSDDEEETTMFSNVEVVEDKEGQQTPMKEDTVELKPEEEVSNENGKSDFRCQYCSICFEDAILHSMHMGYHNRREPFTCNNCGEECHDKFSFFLHIARSRHT